MAYKRKTTKKKTTTKKRTARRGAPKSSAFYNEYTLSPALAALVGKKKASRPKLMQYIWKYIKSHRLQMADNKRMIKPDAKFAAVFGSRPISMFKIPVLLKSHLR